MRRLLWLAWEDRSDIVVVVVYALVTALLALAVPLGTQAVVNTVAAGVALQPLYVLTGAVLVGLLFASLLTLLRIGLVETMQQRVFVRVALRLARALPRVSRRAFTKVHGPELVNRFFDVLTIQKAWASMVGEGPGALIEVAIGLTLLAFYGPQMLVFALALLAAGLLVLVGCSYGGLRTSLRESNEKYRVAGWLEEIAECQTALKLSGAPDFTSARTDAYVRDYVQARRGHFRVLQRHLILHYVLQACAVAGILGIGGWMVVAQQLTLGQLVAAELVMVSVVKAADKLVRLTETWYDLLTALEKVGVLLDLPLERRGARMLDRTHAGAEIKARGVSLGYERAEVLNGLDLELARGEKVVVVGSNGVGKSTLAHLLTGLLVPDRGLLTIDGVDVRDIALGDLHRHVALIHGRNEIMDDSLESNVLLGRDVPFESLRKALDTAMVDETLHWLPEGLQTQLVRGGHNLSRGQFMRVQIARALLTQPRLIVIDDAFDGVDAQTRSTLLDHLFAGPWTLVCITHRADTARRGQRALVLSEGRIVESGVPAQLEALEGSLYAQTLAVTHAV